MSRASRKAVIEQIEQQRSSRVLTYVTGDRAPTPAQIGDDAVRPIYNHLREIGKVPRLDLFVYSRGGAIDVPWRIISALRAAADEWNVLIPFRANSAATMIALGADNIILGRQGELGPIDPIMTIQRVVPGPPGQPPMAFQDQINVEDIMAYVRFVRERAGLSDQEALTKGLGKLTDRLDAVTIGSAYRTHSHTRDVAQKILRSRKSPAPDQVINVIVETLAERVYAHGHAIGAQEATEIGLPVSPADATLDGLLWTLLREYEADLKLLEPIDPNQVVSASDEFGEDATIAVVESSWRVHSLAGQIHIRARRQMPQNVNVALNLNLQVPSPAPGPAGQPPPQLQQALQALLQQLQPQILSQANQAVMDAMRKQAPVVALETKFIGARWIDAP